MVASPAPDNIDPKIEYLRTAIDIVEEYSQANGDDNSNLEKLLVSCWQRGTFWKIRRLSEDTTG